MPNYHADERVKLRERAKAVAAAVVKEQKGGEPLFRSTRHGEVRMDSVVHKVDHAGIDFIEIMAPGAPDPHFRIYNPPLLAEDPLGDIELEVPGRGIVRYAEDPIGALAEVVARHGAAKSKQRWRR